jgi:hypothetical protein
VLRDEVREVRIVELLLPLLHRLVVRRHLSGGERGSQTVMLRQGEVELGEKRDVRTDRPPDDDRRRWGRRVGEDPSYGVGVLMAERQTEPGADQRVVVRRDEDVVGGGAFLDPATGGDRVEVADVLRLLDGVTGGLHPDVGPPRPARLGCPQYVADDPAVAHGGRSGCALGGERRGDGGLRLGRVLVPGGQQRLHLPVPTVPLESSRPASVRWLSSNGMTRAVTRTSG